MVRRKSGLIRSYFIYDENTNISFCKCDVIIKNGNDGSQTRRKCLRFLTGDRASNLEAHLRKIHPELYEDYEKIKGKITPLTGKRSSPYEKPRVVKVEKYVCFPVEPTTTIQVNVDEVLNGIIELFTVNGRPFTLINDSGFKKSFGPLLEACNLRLNSQNIRELIHNRSFRMKNKIKSIVKNKLVSVKLDYAPHLDKCFVGVNVQLLHEGYIVAFSLGSPQLLLRHINENVKRVVSRELEKYDIKLQNIYSVTNDYCENVQKAIKSKNQQMNDDSESEVVGDDGNDSDSVEEDENVELINKILNVKWDDMEVASIHSIARSFQLSVLDTLNNVRKVDIAQSYVDALAKIRSMVVELRRKSNAQMLLDNNFKKPSLDCTSRWESTYVMLKAVVSLCEQFTTENEKFVISDDVREKISEMIVCLTPFKVAKEKLQKESLTITDIYKIIDVCHMSITEIGTPFTRELLYNLNQSRDSLFEQEVFLAAVYLDPRFSFELTEAQRGIAILHIIAIHNKLKAFHKQQIDVTDDLGVNNVEPGPGLLNDPEEEKYERLMRKKHREKIYSASAVKTSEFEVIVRSFKPARLKASESIIKFWEDNKDVYPELYPIASLLFAVPGTQVSLDRLISTLQYILDPLRNCLSSELINDIVLIKNNFSHMYFFNQDCNFPFSSSLLHNLLSTTMNSSN